MTIIDFFRQSIGLMQAVLLLISSIIIGLALSIGEIRLALEHQRADIEQQNRAILTLTQGGATNAAWSLDPDLAREVASGLPKLAGIHSVVISAKLRADEEQTLFRMQPQNTSEYNMLENWVAQRFFADLSRLHQELVVDQTQPPLSVGSLQIDFVPQHHANKFIYTAAFTVAASLFEACLIGLVLFFVAQWLVTLPIQRAARRIASIDPDVLQSEDCKIPIPRLHDRDEIGHLLQHTNLLLGRLKSYQTKLRQMATKDSLTGLANRTLIQEQLATMIANAQRANSLVAVIFIDLDRFKYVNDTFGHDTGDKLLKYVSLSLLRQIRDQDALGRLGGDEFLLIMPTRSLTDVITLAERILAFLVKPCKIDSVELRINASLGIALYPDDGKDPGALMRCADLAMYRAKEHKASQWHLFSEEMKDRLEQGLALETALSQAISKDEIEMYLQPQYRTDNLQRAGCEALLRWQHRGEFVPPAKFIEVAESTGLIGDIGAWVLNQACLTLKRWGRDAVRISVNISSQQLADENFVDEVLANVQKHRVDPSLIEFEITETMLMQNLDRSFEHLTRLRKLGFRISIDDFGTGYSSLSYLTRLPIDALKIDRSFVSGTQQSDIVLTTIIALAKTLNIHVVAEGVETLEQQTLLIENGCDLLQGYLLGKPMAIETFMLRCFGDSEPIRRQNITAV